MVEVRMKTAVHHWRFEPGDRDPPANQFIRGGRIPPLARGWYCWVYPQDYDELESWMQKNCPTADCTNRFNSGDPMITVYIREDREAVLFQLRWM